MAATGGGAGSWEVALDGVAPDGVAFAYGDARSYGPNGAVPPNPVVMALAPAPDHGYWGGGRRGRVPLREAEPLGSAASLRNRPIVEAPAPGRDGGPPRSGRRRGGTQVVEGDPVDRAGAIVRGHPTGDLAARR